MSTMIFLWLAISIAAILGCILVLKLNPTIALVIGSLIMGIGSGLGASATMSSITSGFGGTLGGLGLSVGFGVILGQLLSDSGGAKVIANTLVRRLPKSMPCTHWASPRSCCLSPFSMM